MTNKEAIVNVLNEHPCLNGNEIKGFVKRKYNIDISPQSAAGTLRPLIAAGMAAKSDSPSGKVVYWITNYGKEKMKL